MAIKVTGGVVTLNGLPNVKATVETINFPNNDRVNGEVPVGAQGTMILKNVPDRQNFVVHNVLDYRDGNNNNNAQLTVDRIDGPTKYLVTRTA
ncbi:hypothetical protein MSP8887_03705 [Marinomonas spartinae]|uniref:hypothetical protein n=1 Tax=Marinomonas spartinae TaxID=1792290 RepID=UPI000808D546|nr:hypothetical protein [Marinomonas spartinae]SBS39202.1 hypothetical protein MSP8887_03705 [Marinomonas spartinae]